jgi:hypothetical protein
VRESRDQAKAWTVFSLHSQAENGLSGGGELHQVVVLRSAVALEFRRNNSAAASPEGARPALTES